MEISADFVKNKLSQTCQTPRRQYRYLPDPLNQANIDEKKPAMKNRRERMKELRDADVIARPTTGANSRSWCKSHPP
jgi:hypothetical protein